jgi:hypothetical protein
MQPLKFLELRKEPARLARVSPLLFTFGNESSLPSHELQSVSNETLGEGQMLEQHFAVDGACHFLGSGGPLPHDTRRARESRRLTDARCLAACGIRRAAIAPAWPCSG